MPVLVAPPLRHSLLSLFQATLGITLIVFLDRYLHRDDIVLAIASFGATAVLVYSAVDSPLAQVRGAAASPSSRAERSVTQQIWPACCHTASERYLRARDLGGGGRVDEQGQCSLVSGPPPADSHLLPVLLRSSLSP